MCCATTRSKPEKCCRSCWRCSPRTRRRSRRWKCYSEAHAAVMSVANRGQERNRRSLGCARDDKGGDGASSQYPMVAEAVPCPSILADFQPPLSTEAPPPPLSSRPGFPATRCWTKPRLRLSLKERRMECAKATNLNRKSGGAQPRDLRFSRPYLGMFVGLSSRLIGSSLCLPDARS